MRTTRRYTDPFAVCRLSRQVMRDQAPFTRVAERGFAVLVVLALLALIVLLVAANTHTTNWLRREVKLVEKRQGERLAVIAADRPPAKADTTQKSSAP